jgi:hypothetical protein
MYRIQYKTAQKINGTVVPIESSVGRFYVCGGT